MIIWRIITHEGEGDYGLVVGVVLDQDGSHSADQALATWNNAHPSYQGDTAMTVDYMTI